MTLWENNVHYLGFYFCLQLIDFETNEDIDEPNVPGELWLKGPGIFKVLYT